ncbi:MAG: endonuclease/exonuclease/phosphatase family protein, partial [Arcobacteraceae bacterium]
KYSIFTKNKNTAIGLGLMSKFPIVSSKNIIVDKYDKYSRDILKVIVEIENKPLIIYNNHWRSKKAKESQRIKYALALKKDVDALDEDKDYIILGDLNSNYNEYQTFKYDKNLNDTFNITGINQILNTTIDENFIHKHTLFSHNKKVHFNTWLELPINNRFSTKFKKQNNTPDNLILSKGLFDNQNISYIDKSFNIFKPNYLFNNKKIIRWNKHKLDGYSDHLPIYAFFSTQSQNYDLGVIKTHIKKSNGISHLYTIEQISNYDLKDVIVIYKAKNIAILKQLNDDKSIMLYKPSDKLKLGYIYDLTVNNIDLYFGLKEIKNVSNIVLKKSFENFKELYLDGNKIDLQNPQYINSVITNLEGVYSQNYLYLDNTKIRLYFPKGIKKPEEKSKLFISSGHLSIYKSLMQIVLHDEEDFIRR